MRALPPTVLTALVTALSCLAGVLPGQRTVVLEPSHDVALLEYPIVPLVGPVANGAGSRLCVGVDALGRRKRAVYAFDLTSIPPCSTVTSVSLQLTIAMTIDLTPRTMGLHRMTRSWGEADSLALIRFGGGQCGGGTPEPGDATWDHAFLPATPWTTPGGEFAAAASAATAVGTVTLVATTWASTPQLVADVQEWVDDPASNFGWLVLGDESETMTTRAFFSREELVASRRPQLTVTYREPDAAVTATGPGCAGSGTVPLTLSATGLPTVPGPGFALALSGGPATPLRGYALSLALAPVPLPLGGGCFLHVHLPFAAVLPATGAGLPLPIPNDPQLLGQGFPAQGMALDASPSPFVTSNALVLKLGR